MKIWRLKLENNTLNGVLDSGSNETITEKRYVQRGPVMFGEMYG